MPYELHNVKLRDIDLERGILSIRGYKGHASRTFKLKSETVAMLKWYVNTFRDKKPLFPNPRAINVAWRRYRKRASEKFQDSSILTIRLYDLRHYYATMLYHKTRDILLVKSKLGHKRIETTLIYTQLIDFKGEEYYSAIAKTVKEARALIEEGYEYVCEIEGVKLFRKRK